MVGVVVGSAVLLMRGGKTPDLSALAPGAIVSAALAFVSAFAGRNARRANALAILAETGRGVRFLLDGRRIEIRDALGRDHESITLTIREKHRADLLEMPPARLVER